MLVQRPQFLNQNEAAEVTIEPEGKLAPQVINIMEALKQSMQKQRQTKTRDAVRKRMGKATPKVGVSIKERDRDAPPIASDKAASR